MNNRFEIYLTDENYADIIEVLNVAKRTNNALAEDYIQMGANSGLSRFYKTAYEYKRKTELINVFLEKLHELGE